MIKITLGIALAIDCSNVVITIVLLGDLGTKIAAARDPHELLITNLQLIGTVTLLLLLLLLNYPAGMTRRSSEEKILAMQRNYTTTKSIDPSIP
jgi:hypothetical protein